MLNVNTANVIAGTNEINPNKKIATNGNKTNTNDNNTVLPNKFIRLIERGHKKKDRRKLLESKHDARKTIGDWYVGSLLGKGGFGQVLMGIDRITGEQVALKFIKTNKIPANFLASEIDAFQKINHDNVIKLICFNLNVFGNNNIMLLCFEFAQYGELFDILDACDHFDQGVTLIYLKQIINALKACHDINIIHRDLKPQNLLIGENFELKIADFGMCNIKKSSNQSTMEFESKTDNYRVGTRQYMAPEIIINACTNDNDTKDTEFDTNDIEISKSCDIFSLGVIVWQMLNGIKSTPFESASSNDKSYKLIIEKKYNIFWENNKNTVLINENKSNINVNVNVDVNVKQIKNLLECMFEFDPRKRIRAKQLLAHPWICNNSNSKDNEAFQVVMANAYVKSHRIRMHKKRMLHQMGIHTSISSMVCVYSTLGYISFLMCIQIFVLRHIIRANRYLVIRRTIQQTMQVQNLVFKT